MTLEMLAWYSLGLFGAGVMGAASYVLYDIHRESKDAAEEERRIAELELLERKAAWSRMAAPRHAHPLELEADAADPEDTGVLRIPAHARLEDIDTEADRQLLNRYRREGPSGSLGTIDGRPRWATVNETRNI